MKIARILTGAALAASLCACSHAPQSSIGLIDVPRLSQNWPLFLNAQNQLNADAQAIERSGHSDAQKARERAQLQSRFAQIQGQIANDVSGAAKQVAIEKHLQYVFTRQFVGYGGIDITPDVEKKLNITESSPKP